MVISSGLLLYRRSTSGELEVLLGHMGGPLWAHKHEHAWSIPKGLAEVGETDLLAVAEREFDEEMGSRAPNAPTIELGSVPSGSKTITIFAREGDFDAENASSNTFSMEWPRGSGKFGDFLEIDRAEWVPVSNATTYLTKGQGPFVQRLVDALAAD